MEFILVSSRIPQMRERGLSYILLKFDGKEPQAPQYQAKGSQWFFWLQLPAWPMLKLFCSSVFLPAFSSDSRYSCWWQWMWPKIRFICASWVFNAGTWKQQPDSKLPQILILALVLFASGHLANNFPALCLGLCLSLTQLSSVQRKGSHGTC